MSDIGTRYPMFTVKMSLFFTQKCYIIWHLVFTYYLNRVQKLAFLLKNITIIITTTAHYIDVIYIFFNNIFSPMLSGIDLFHCIPVDSRLIIPLPVVLQRTSQN